MARDPGRVQGHVPQEDSSHSAGVPVLCTALGPAVCARGCWVPSLRICLFLAEQGRSGLILNSQMSVVLPAFLSTEVNSSYSSLSSQTRDMARFVSLQLPPKPWPAGMCCEHPTEGRTPVLVHLQGPHVQVPLVWDGNLMMPTAMSTWAAHSDGWAGSCLCSPSVEKRDRKPCPQSCPMAGDQAASTDLQLGAGLTSGFWVYLGVFPDCRVSPSSLSTSCPPATPAVGGDALWDGTGVVADGPLSPAALLWWEFTHLSHTVAKHPKSSGFCILSQFWGCCCSQRHRRIFQSPPGCSGLPVP